MSNILSKSMVKSTFFPGYHHFVSGSSMCFQRTKPSISCGNLFPSPHPPPASARTATTALATSVVCEMARSCWPHWSISMSKTCPWRRVAQGEKSWVFLGKRNSQVQIFDRLKTRDFMVISVSTVVIWWDFSGIDKVGLYCDVLSCSWETLSLAEQAMGKTAENEGS